MIDILKKNFHFGYIIFFSIILIFFGINDVEEYQRGTLSTKLHWQSFKSFFNTFFYDSIGPGVKIPINAKSKIKDKNNFLVVLAWNFFQDIKKNNLNLSNNFINIKELEKD